jgi:hypothetical protein
MSIHLCTLRAVRAAPVAAMAREPLLHASVLLLCCYVDAPGQKCIPHLFCARFRHLVNELRAGSRRVGFTAGPVHFVDGRSGQLAELRCANAERTSASCGSLHLRTPHRSPVELGLPFECGGSSFTTFVPQGRPPSDRGINWDQLRENTAQGYTYSAALQRREVRVFLLSS